MNISLVGMADPAEALDDWERTKRAIQFLETERDPRKPFFAVVGFHSPHLPWDSTATTCAQGGLPGRA